MRLVDYTEERLLLPVLEATDRPDVCRELTEQLKQCGSIGEVDAFMREVRAPDGVFHAGTEHSVVFEWARGRFVHKTRFALGKSAPGIHFGPKPDATAHLVFLIAAPTTKGCVDLLTALARLLYDVNCRSKLVAARTSREMREALASQPPEPVSTQLGLQLGTPTAP